MLERSVTIKKPGDLSVLVFNRAGQGKPVERDRFPHRRAGVTLDEVKSKTDFRVALKNA